MSHIQPKLVDVAPSKVEAAEDTSELLGDELYDFVTNQPVADTPAERVRLMRLSISMVKH